MGPRTACIAKIPTLERTQSNGSLDIRSSARRSMSILASGTLKTAAASMCTRIKRAWRRITGTIISSLMNSLQVTCRLRDALEHGSIRLWEATRSSLIRKAQSASTLRRAPSQEKAKAESQAATFHDMSGCSTQKPNTLIGSTRTHTPQSGWSYTALTITRSVVLWFT